MARYLVGLLIFLGLLGTFWGLLETVQSIGGAIDGLDVNSSQSATLFDQLKQGLQAPLKGMGLSFSSSLFGLAGSLILGFLDLKASQAQNRFYTDLEDWLSSMTDIAAGEAQPAAQQQGIAPQLLRTEIQSLQRAVEKLTFAIENPRASTGSGPMLSPRKHRLDRAACRCRGQPRHADARGTEDRAPVGTGPADPAERDPAPSDAGHGPSGAWRGAGSRRG